MGKTLWDMDMQSAAQQVCKIPLVKPHVFSQLGETTADDEQLCRLRKQVLCSMRAGNQAAASFTRKHMLSGKALEKLADRRTQSASMPSDIDFVRA